MNKKLFLGMFAVAGMLLATSCQNDELDAVQAGNEATVSFTLGVEGGVKTRAISDGTGAKKLVYAVYDANGALLNITGSNEKGQFEETAFENGLSDEVTVTLAKGQTYTIAFWAQNGACTAYNTDDLTAVTVNYGDENTTYDNNDETRDAFFAAVPFEVRGDKTIDVVLKRPFAQINVGVTEKDWIDATASGIEIEKSAVIIKSVANEINLLTGAVKGDENVAISYVENDIPNETLYVETDATKEGKEAYKWLSMSYILVDDENGGANQATLQSLEYTFIPKNGTPVTFNEGLNNVPVQRNWRTNILGKLLTGDVQFNITIDPVYDGDIIFPDATGKFAELEYAASFGGTVTLTESLTMPGERPYLRVSEDFILNINENVDFTTGNASNYGIIVNNGTTEINGSGNIHSLGGGIGVSNGASVVFNGGNLDVNTESTSGRYLFYLEGENTTATINGGNFDFNKTQNQKRAYIYAGEGTTVYVKGGTFGKASSRNDYKAGIMGNGTVVITGGVFGFDPTTWVAEGYEVKTVGGEYVVFSTSSNVVANADELSNALNSAGNIELYNDIDYSNKQIAINNNLVIDMNGKELKAGSNSAYGVKVDGVYAQIDEANINSLGGGIGAENGAEVVFNGGNLAVNSASTSGRYNFYAVGTGTTITIEEGTFSFSSTQNQKRAYIYAGSGATVYVKGGNFGKASARDGYTAGILGNGTVVITGGTFGFNPTAWVKDGYVATENNGVWTVSAE